MDVCDRMTIQLSAWLDGELTAQEEQELTAHLDACPQCRALAQQLKACRDAVEQLGEAEPPQDFAQRVLDQIAAEQPRTVIPFPHRPQFKALAGLAACAVVCLGLTRLTWSGGFSGGAAETADAATQSVATVEEPSAQYADMESAAGSRSKTTLDTFIAESIETEHQPQEALPETDGTPAGDSASVLASAILPVTWDEALPQAQLISTGEQLVQLISAFPEDDLTQLAQTYGDGFFSSGKQLVAVVQPGGAGFELLSLSYENNALTVTLQQTPAPQDGSSMTARLLLLELGDAYPPNCVCRVVLEAPG